MQSLESQNLPKVWEWGSLDEVLTVLESGGRPKGGVKQYSSGVPSIGGEHLNNNGSFNFSKIRFVPASFYNSMNKGKIQKFDVLVVKDGATTGKTSLVNENFPYEKAAVNEHVFILRGNEKIITQPYLFYFLYSTRGQNQIQERFQGSAQGGINSNFVKNFKIPIAPVPEQIRIVAKIGELFKENKSSRDAIDKIPLIMKKIKQSIIFSASLGNLTKSWRSNNQNVKSAHEILHRINLEHKNDFKLQSDTNLPQIPSTWEWTLLRVIADIRGGITKGKNYKGKKTIKLPYLRVANVQDGYLDLSEIKEIEALPEDLERYRLQKGDVLFNEGGDRDKLGRGCVWNDEIKGCIHQNHVFRARLISKEILPEYLTIFSKSDFARQYFFAEASQTVNLASLNMTALGNLPIAIPPLEEQLEIIKIIEENSRFVSQIEESVEEAKKRADKIDQAILVKAFRGELVTQDPNDEPVSILLEKIKKEKELEIKPVKTTKRRTKIKN